MLRLVPRLHPSRRRGGAGDRGRSTMRKMTKMTVPRIRVSNLVDYREDMDARRRFERRFALPSLIGLVAGFVGGVTKIFILKNAAWPIVLFAFGIIVLIGTVAAMYFSTAVSVTGRPMKKYWNDDEDSDGNELVYVCDDSKTYFRRTFARRGKGRIGSP